MIVRPSLLTPPFALRRHLVASSGYGRLFSSHLMSHAIVIDDKIADVRELAEMRIERVDVSARPQTSARAAASMH